MPTVPRKGRTSSGLFAIPRNSRGILAALLVSAMLHGVLIGGAGLADAPLADPHKAAGPAGTVRTPLAGMFSIFLGDARVQGEPGGAAFPDVAGTTASAAGGTGAVFPSLPDAVDSLFARRYYKISEVDERPQIREQIEPEFPLVLDPGTKGSVILRLFIDTSGKVEKAVVIRSEPAEIFDQAAIEAFRGASYTPARRGRTAVPVQLAVEVHFDSTGRK